MVSTLQLQIRAWSSVKREMKSGIALSGKLLYLRNQNQKRQFMNDYNCTCMQIWLIFANGEPVPRLEMFREQLFEAEIVIFIVTVIRPFQEEKNLVK